ncbi:MAG: type II toxin-antitoxin system VapC family toxin [Burkholderiales bacterium]
MPSVLLDTGPLVALFKRNDTYHARSVAWFKSQRGPLLTTQAVLTEAWHLVSVSARIPLVRFVQATCEIVEFDTVAHARILAALERFADMEMDYADATLLVLGEIEKVTAIATIDVNDFTAYRMSNGKGFRLVF